MEQALEKSNVRVDLLALPSDITSRNNQCDWNDDYGDGKICLAATTNSENIQTLCLTALTRTRLEVEGKVRQTRSKVNLVQDHEKI